MAREISLVNSKSSTKLETEEEKKREMRYGMKGIWLNLGSNQGNKNELYHVNSDFYFISEEIRQYLRPDK